MNLGSTPYRQTSKTAETASQTVFGHSSLFSQSVRRKMPRSQVSAFMFSRTYTYDYSVNAKQVNRFLDGKLPADDPVTRQIAVFLQRFSVE
jgi:hypothetical protein